MNPRRIERLQRLILERAAQVIGQELADPRRGLITVTKAVLDKEMMGCKIFWSLIGTEAQRRTNERMLESARGFVQREIAAVLHTRTAPRISFVFDESIEGAVRIDSILDELRRERGDTPPPDTAT